MNTTTNDPDTIKFTHAKNGEISFSAGRSVFSDLFTIGAFAATRTLEHRDANVWHEYPTDTHGLECLAVP